MHVEGRPAQNEGDPVLQVKDVRSRPEREQPGFQCGQPGSDSVRLAWPSLSWAHPLGGSVGPAQGGLRGAGWTVSGTDGHPLGDKLTL